MIGLGRQIQPAEAKIPGLNMLIPAPPFARLQCGCQKEKKMPRIGAFSGTEYQDEGNASTDKRSRRRHGVGNSIVPAFFLCICLMTCLPKAMQKGDRALQAVDNAILEKNGKTTAFSSLVLGFLLTGKTLPIQKALFWVLFAAEPSLGRYHEKRILYKILLGNHPFFDLFFSLYGQSLSILHASCLTFYTRCLGPGLFLLHALQPDEP